MMFLELVVWCNKWCPTGINDLPDVVQSFIFLFADGNKLFCSIVSDPDVVLLQANIDSFLIWSKNWLLNLSISKYKCMRIGISNCSSHSYLINGKSHFCYYRACWEGFGCCHWPEPQISPISSCCQSLGLISKCFKHLYRLCHCYIRLLYVLFWNMQMLRGGHTTSQTRNY